MEDIKEFSKLKWFLFSLFIIGIILAILGWLFDRVSHFPWLMRKISPDYVNGINALDTLAENEKHAITTFNPGFNVILECWPGLTRKSLVTLIGRSVAYMGFGSQVTSDFELIAYDKDRSEITPRWENSSAQSMLVDEQNKRLFWIGTVVFFSGLGIAFVSGVLEFLNIKAKS